MVATSARPPCGMADDNTWVLSIVTHGPTAGATEALQALLERVSTPSWQPDNKSSSRVSSAASGARWSTSTRPASAQCRRRSARWSKPPMTSLPCAPGSSSLAPAARTRSPQRSTRFARADEVPDQARGVRADRGWSVRWVVGRL